MKNAMCITLMPHVIFKYPVWLALKILWFFCTVLTITIFLVSKIGLLLFFRGFTSGRGKLTFKNTYKDP